MRTSMSESLGSIEGENDKEDEKLTVLTSDLDVFVKKMGVTTQELKDEQDLAKQMKVENDPERRALPAKATVVP